MAHIIRVLLDKIRLKAKKGSTKVFSFSILGDSKTTSSTEMERKKVLSIVLLGSSGMVTELMEP